MIDIFKALLGEHFNKIIDEVNFNNDGECLVIKKLTGTNFKSAVIQPIQLQAYVRDINKYVEILREFAQNNTGITYNLGMTQIKMSYETPQLLNVWSEINDNYQATVVVNGMFIISQDISDIKEIKIDGELVDFDTAILTYAGAVNTRKPRNENKTKSQIIGGVNNLTINLISKVSPVLQKVRRVRRGDDILNIEFNIEITYIDDDYTENYIMVLSGAGIEASNSNMPLMTLTFTE